MNNKIISIVAVIISVSIIIFAISEVQTDEENVLQQSMDEENVLQQSMDEEIQSKLDKIKQDRIENLNSEQPYSPAERDWPTSGPFKIDRSQYLLGEKIFVNIDTLALSDKGKMTFLRPLNDTHYKTYYSMPFDGTRDRNNFYFTPDLSVARGICDKTQLIGDWKVIFEGTNYPDLEFKVIDRILPGEVYRYGNMEDANDIGIEFEQKC
ncbi:hypothetical protein OAK22_04170 [Nitrosopumilus sp.]|nr:hypothetical protein [Nitrosopumilus sp.]